MANFCSTIVNIDGKYTKFDINTYGAFIQSKFNVVKQASDSFAKFMKRKRNTKKYATKFANIMLNDIQNYEYKKFTIIVTIATTKFKKGHESLPVKCSLLTTVSCSSV